ncbi:MAG: Txe/YoeB family addiction module toxin [Oscillospiraceae bacterium]|nr:Txe/YoeB family addiction module toxin [Oscillospiraceae bacterium]
MPQIENIIFTVAGLEDYIYWQTQDRKTLNKINKLINDIIRNGHEGIGHPEPLKHDLSGQWSRTIDDKNRLTYMIHDDKRIEIFSCRGHYSDK